MEYTIKRYETADGIDVFDRWFATLADHKAKAAIFRRLSRLEAGLFGDCKPVGSGVWEMRVNSGPGYRVYYSIVEKQIVLLLLGGNKRTQNKDIEKAIQLLDDYKRRNKK